MTQLLHSLKSYIVLSLSDLTHIKETISRRYDHMTSSERAEILSMAVHNHLNKHLSGIDDTHKTSLKLSILSNTLAKHDYSITRLTIFDAIIDLNLDDVVKTELAENWLFESAHTSVPRKALENYLIQKRSVTGLETDFVNHTFDEGAQFNVEKDDIHSRSLDNKAPFFDHTPSVDVKHFWALKKSRVVAILILFIIIATPSQFLFKSILQPSVEPIRLSSQLDANDYTGMSAMDRIYLIDGIDGYKENDQVNLTLEKSRYPFGLIKKTDSFRFANFDYYAVKNYISQTRKGMIGSSEQFNQIIHEAYLNDIDPLLLFAIIGQEQAFVPNTSTDSLKILNNPYNVYHSWAEYNTTLRDSTQIAINTIKNRLDKAPKSVSAFQWLNETYAEDKNWHNGVSLIYAHLVSIGRDSSIH